MYYTQHMWAFVSTSVWTLQQLSNGIQNGRDHTISSEIAPKMSVYCIPHKYELPGEMFTA